jgi:hypothetical protein
MANKHDDDSKHVTHKTAAEAQREYDASATKKTAAEAQSEYDGLVPSPEVQKDQQAAAAKLVDDYEAAEPGSPLTTQTDQLARSADMEAVGPGNWMAETEARIQERSGDEPPPTRQARGIAPVQPPR